MRGYLFFESLDVGSVVELELQPVYLLFLGVDDLSKPFELTVEPWKPTSYDILLLLVVANSLSKHFALSHELVVAVLKPFEFVADCVEFHDRLVVLLLPLLGLLHFDPQSCVEPLNLLN